MRTSLAEWLSASDRPVYVGDFCKFGDSVGTVEDIGLRSTRIRTNDRTEVIVPNAQFSTMTLENFSRRDKMLFHPMLNLRRDTSPEQVRTILAAIQKILKDHPNMEAGDLAVRFVGVGSYSLDVEVFAYVLTLDGSEFLRIQQDLLLNILDAVAAAGTALALPTQASVVYGSQDGSPAAAKQVNQLDHQYRHYHQLQDERAGFVKRIDQKFVEFPCDAQLLLHQVPIVRHADFIRSDAVGSRIKHIAEKLDGVVGPFRQFDDVQAHGVEVLGLTGHPPAACSARLASSPASCIHP